MCREWLCGLRHDSFTDQLRLALAAVVVPPQQAIAICHCKVLIKILLLILTSKICINVAFQCCIYNNAATIFECGGTHPFLPPPSAIVCTRGRPHKSQKWIYKIKTLLIDKFSVSTLAFNVTQIHLVDLAVTLKR